MEGAKKQSTSDRILERLNTNRISRFESPVTNHPSVDDIQQFNFSVRQRLATLHRVSTEMNDADQRRLLSAMAVKLERNQQLGRWPEGGKSQK